MATSRGNYFPREVDDTPGDRLLQTNSDRRNSGGIEYRPPPRARSRSRSGSRTTSCSSSKSPRRKFISFWAFFLIVIGVAVMFLLGVCVGFYVRELQMDNPDFKKICGVVDEEDKEATQINLLGGYHESLAYYIRGQGIREFIEKFGEDDPRTGDRRERMLASAVLDDFRAHSVGSVSVENYDVVTTSPDPVHPNELEVLHHNGSRLLHLQLRNNAPQQNKSSDGEQKGGNRQKRRTSKTSGWGFPHVAFSPPGVAEGRLVYAHFGRQTDFQVLQALGVDVRDAVVLLRMGKISVADKIRTCETHGAKAALLYWEDSDVIFDVPDEIDSSSFVPFASAMDYTIGEDKPWCPSIPCQTISADQADTLLTLTLQPLEEQADNIVVASPWQWRGSTGAGFGVGLKREGNMTADAPTVRVSVFNQPKKQRIKNIIHTIQGAEEIDRYVIVGSPRASLPGQPEDAVVSTSILAQLGRAFRHVHRLEGWLPRRGVKLVSWGGADLAHLGMMEMVRKQHILLDRRVVAYFDLRNLVLGNETLTANIPPSLEQLFNEIGYDVPDPKDAEQTLHVAWKDLISKRLPVGTYNGDTTHNPLLHTLGVPVVHLQYMGPKGSRSVLSEATRQEQVHHFKFHLAATRMLTLALLNVLDSRLLPFDLTDAAQSLHDTVWQTSEGLQECSGDKHRLAKSLYQCKRLESTAKAFSDLAHIYLGHRDQARLHSMNDVAMTFDRLFLIQRNGRPHHLLYPALSDGTMALASELCQAGNIIGDWNMTQQFDGMLSSRLAEALVLIRIGA